MERMSQLSEQNRELRHLIDTKLSETHRSNQEQLGKTADLAKLLALARMQANEGRTLAHPLNRALQLEAWLIEYRHVFD